MARRKWWIQARSQVRHLFLSSLKRGADVSYAPGVVPASEAAKAGYGQILWLSGDDHTLTEVSLPILASWAKLMDRSEQ